MAVYFPFVDIYLGTPYYSTGTASVTAGSATVSGGSTAWASSMNGGIIVFDKSVGATYNPVSFISTVGSGTSLTLKSAFGGGTNYTTIAYIADNPSTNNWRIRIFPRRRQFSIGSKSISTVIPLSTSGSDPNDAAVASVMPLANSDKIKHIDGMIYADSSNRSGSDTLEEVIADIERLADYNGILGYLSGYTNLLGASATGIIIKRCNIDDAYPLRNKSLDGTFGQSTPRAQIQLDVEVCSEF